MCNVMNANNSTYIATAITPSYYNFISKEIVDLVEQLSNLCTAISRIKGTYAMVEETDWKKITEHLPCFERYR